VTGGIAKGDIVAFVTAQTRIASPSLVPELRLYLATEVTPLWEATEATLAQHNLPPPYWAFAWPGGQALARHLLDNPGMVRGRRVLDFAAGGGIAAIAAARVGAHATSCDIDRVATTVAAMNAALNNVAVTTIEADLTQRTAAEIARDWDVVLAGDVFYERPMAERVEPWLRGLAAVGLTVIVADPGRTYLPKSGLAQIASYSVPTSRDLEDREMRETRLYRVSA